VPEIAGPETTSLSLTVSDGSSRGVIGAEVRRSSDGTIVGYTGYDGYLAFEQPSGTTETYYANTTDTDPYESDIDVITEPVAVPAYVPVATATEADFADGTAFDDQEYANGDIALQVVDGRGDPFATTEMVTYSLYRTVDGPSDPVTESTNEDGRLVVPFDPSAEDGEYTLTYSVPESADPDGEGATQSVTFVAGDAVLGLTPLAGTAPSGGAIGYEGTLTVEGQPLADRDVDLAYTRGTEQAPGTDADAALVIGAQRTLTGAATTDDDGTFTVTVGDVAEAGGPAESGGKLRVTVLGDTIDATADFTQVVTPPTPLWSSVRSAPWPVRSPPTTTAPSP
jgi:hypothetical protein